METIDSAVDEGDEVTEETTHMLPRTKWSSRQIFNLVP